MRIAMIGTRGVPARYGGFETAVEEVGRRLADRGHVVTVFCRGAQVRHTEYLGMRLVHLPAIRQKVAETISHTTLSVLHKAARSADVALLFNAANAPLLPILKKAGVPTAVHVDGLEWKRSKWGRMGRRYYLANERLAVRWADRLIADARGIQDHYTAKYAAESVFIPYGAPLLQNPPLARLAEQGLEAGGYHLVVARFEPENHVLEAVAAHAQRKRRLPLVVVGSAPYSSDYSAKISNIAAGSDRIRLLGGVWDQELLDLLYAGCLTYIHGHSVGGTNPSLLRAMGAASPVLAYDVNFNREVAGSCAAYWGDTPSLADAMDTAEADPAASRARGERGRERVAQRYNWDQVAVDYERLCFNLANDKP